MRTPTLLLGDEERVYDGHHVTLSRLSFTNRATGQSGVWEILRRKEASGNIVGILGVTPKLEAIVVRVYRIPLKNYVLQPCYGGLEPGELEQDGALRELAEETGYKAARARRLFAGPFAQARTDEQIAMYVGPNAQLVRKQKLDDAEDIEVLLMPLRNAPEQLRSLEALGQLVDIKLWSAVYAARDLLNA